MNLTLESPTKKMPKKPSDRNYFTQDTEDAIVLYNRTEDPIIKSKIYEDGIHYAFFKLTQNIIHTFKFYHTEVENLEHLQHEIIVFLLSKIHLFNPENGAKAYSYFGTIVKRWLILYNEKNYKSKISKVSTDELLKDDTHSYTIDGSNSNDKLSNFIDEWVEFVSFNIYEIFPKEYDAKIADAILELFRKRDQIDVFNKKALYIYIHEMIPDAKTPKITKIANILYNIFKKNYLFYLEQGYTDFQIS
jgi:hypothetical protein